MSKPRHEKAPAAAQSRRRFCESMAALVGIDRAAVGDGEASPTNVRRNLGDWRNAARKRKTMAAGGR
jgi:hypothetical protein